VGVADGQTDRPGVGLRLPAGTRNLQINYTAPDLADPWVLQFRYKLDGVDAHWQDAGPRRTAYYTNLHPRKYEFRVMEGNTVAGLNPNAAAIDFTIPPFWYQTMWVQALCGAGLLLLLWSLYRLRMRQMERQFTLAQGTRVDERIRIARELHDTLLQSFHGLLFRFQAARNMLPQKTEAAIQVLDAAILATEQAIAEGRDAIHDLRPESAVQHDLSDLLTAVGQELSDAQEVNGRSPAFRLIVEGQPQKLSPLLHDEIYRIGREVIRNAFRHAAAGHIEVEILYDGHKLRLRFRDDGKGIAPENLAASGRPGHWGLPGIRERAERIGSSLKFWSEAGAGTEVELTIPAALAYEKQRDRRRFGPSHRGGCNGGYS